MFTNGFYFPVDIYTVKQYGLERWQREFFWPVSDREFAALCDAIEQCIIYQIRHLPKEIGDTLLVKRNLASEYYYFLHALWVMDRITQQGKNIVYSDQALFYKKLQEGGYEKQSDSISGHRSSILPHTHAQEHWLWQRGKRSAQTILYNLSLKNFVRRFGNQHHILLYDGFSALVRSYLQKTLPTWVSVTRPGDWLGAQDTSFLSSSFVEQLCALSATLVHNVARIAAQCQIPLLQAHTDYLERFTQHQLIEAATALQIMRQKMLAKHMASKHFCLPIIYAPLQRIIALVAQDNGGKVTTFTHGGHIGLYDNYSLALSEFALSNEFVTYTKGTVPLFQKMFADHPPVRSNTVRIVSADYGGYLKLWERLRTIPPPLSLRRVMIVGCPQNQWRTSLIAASLPFMELDLELRLASLLREIGYRVIYKAHPDRLAEIRGVFDDCATVVEGYFEDCLDAADAFVFVTLRTTAFPLALCTNKPVFSFIAKDEQHKPHPEAMMLLRKRCTFIEAEFDERNRLRFDERVLREALAQPPTAPNMEFAEKYLFP